MLNFDGGFSIGSEKEPQIGGPWIPLTPHKPAAVKSHLIQLGEHPNGYSQEQPRHDGNAGHFASVGLMDLNEETYDLGMGGLPRKKEVINHIAGSYANAFINKAPGFSGVRFTDLLMSGPERLNSGVQPNGTRLPDRYPLPNLNLGCGKDGDCSISDPIGLLLESQSNRNLWSNNSHQTPQCGFPVPYGPSCNTNTLTTEFNASSSVANSFQLAPVTPDQTRRFEKNHLSNVSDFSIERFGHEKYKQEHLVPFARSESVGHHSDELLQNIVDSSSATAISVSFREKIDAEKGRDQDFDLNKTPQLKAPKKRKHRPKVIREGKPKRTPKSAIPEKTNPTESRPGKRKYVRKNGTKASATKLEDVTKETTDPFIRYAAKTCRRVLNFDTEKTGDDSQAKIVGQNEQMQNINKRVFNLNSGIQAHKSCTGTSSISTADHSHQNRLIVETLQLEASFNHSHSVNQKPSQHMSQPERIHPETAQSTMADLQLKTSAVPRCAISGNAQTCHRNNRSAYSSTQQHIHAGVSQIVFQTQNIHGNLERTRQLLLNSSRRSGVNDSTNGSQRRGSKREYCHTTEAAHPPTINLVNSSLLCQEIFQRDKSSNNGFNIETGSRETNKKTRIENGFSKEGSFTPCVTTGDSVKHVIRYDWKDVNENYSPTQINRGNLTPSQESNKAPNNLNDGINKIVSDWYLRFMAAECQMQRQQNSSELHPYKGKADSGIPNGSTHFYNHLATTTACKMLPSTLPRTTTGPNYRQILDNCHVSQLAEKQTVEATFSYPVSSNKDRLLQCTDSLDYHQQSSIKASDPRQKQKYPVLVDEILSRLEELNLNNKNNKIVRKEQNALVPHKSDSKIVPFEGLDHLKKHKSRPKVDLDPETNRIWKLLMEEGSNGTEGINKDTEKYWEEEREVFRGRADSFIARMHLVQGDRRFSQWKGSVVDSVIGVFLTQNVSDHLSSSAFMSLVAQFPFQPISSNTTSYKNESNMKAEGPELSVLYTNDTNNWSEKVANQQIYHYSSATQEATGRNADGTISRVGENILEAQNLRVEEVISSQDSFDSGIIKVAGGLRSSSGSNSEAEDSASACKPDWMQSSTSEDIQQRNITAMFEEFYYNGNGSPLFFESSMNGQKQLEDMGYCRQRVILDREDNLKIPSVVTYPITSIQNHTQAEIFPSSDYLLHPTGDSRLLEEDFLETWGEESISSWSTTASRRKTADNMNSTNKSGQMEESNDKYSVHQQLKPSGNGQCQLNNNQHDRAWASELQGTTVACPGNPVELDTKRLNSTPRQVPHVPTVAPETSEFEGRPLVNKQTHLKNNVVKPNLKEHDFPSGDTHSTTKTTTSRVKKGKAEGDKKTAYNWESLRKQVQPNCTKTTRSKDTMDSLDYEALRKARVDEISAIIKERGMNNMLAERIKDFLNRLVKDHGNVDLEWLRDAPPDKAKEYLLSIRGLGLKSVECVRLLTLRHLAFPVDTNVGRIAVRLGWVPLQPLPESVQLHLLELYPVLESIQKYLWPRLCKLDQRTLYELHYQMITFGKVFCTKSRPNCNACPMRAECRHFASAFASARLALPGPEEKGIVSPLVPIAANRNPVPINPMSLPSPDKYQNGVPGSASGKCEPIIEVPATPEPECADISESDIEDAFYEDPDEIPTIKLNIEEFTTNLQTYMQQNNMELQEGDMSKALVALNPAASSIPTPKLKNVSRLRTEHQVYELPDSHPLLNEMDIREPDDPSPYLLAIWTPGETANSIQPPERRCESQESGKLCNEDTCFSCNSTRESNSQTVRGTILIPCRTAMRGSFPLNGTYFQVNEVFADHVSSLNPIDVPRSWIWNLPRRTVYFGTSVSTIFKGLTTEGIQYCFWRGFVCVRGFDQKTRAPRPLMARLHFPASKLAKTKNAKTSDK